LKHFPEYWFAESSRFEAALLVELC